MIRGLRTEKKSLTNFKYLLETQIQDIQREKEPLNECIQSLNEEIKDLKKYIEKQGKIIVEKDLEVSQKGMKLCSQIKNVKSLERTIRMMKREFLTLSGLVGDDDNNNKANHKLLKDKLDLAYQKYRLPEY